MPTHACPLCGAVHEIRVPPPDFNVRDYGAKGDGETSDVEAFKACISAASGAPVVVPVGVYRLPEFIVPPGTDLVGAGIGSHLRGKLWFGSDSSFHALKLGDKGFSVRNAKAAKNTTFTGCRFRGGGGDSKNFATLLLGFSTGYLASHLTFKDCEFERAFGTGGVSVNPGNDTVYVQEQAQAGGAHNEFLTFDGCHFGVSNGVQAGCARMDLELYTTASPCAQNWHDLTVKDCTFEVSDGYNIDLSTAIRSGSSDQGTGRNLITGCHLKGGRTNTLCIESPQGLVVEKCRIGRGGSASVKYGRSNILATPMGSVLRGNVIDLDADNGIAHPVYQFYVRGVGNVIEGNEVFARTVPADSGHALFGFDMATDSRITGNTIHWKGTYTNRWRPGQFSNVGGTNTNNVTEPNTWTT